MISCLNRNVFNNLLFEGINETDLELLDFNRFVYYNYSPGDILIKEGEPGDFMLLIVSGTVAVTKKINNIDVELGFRSVGEYVGEMALFDGELRSATVTANSMIEAYSINADFYQYLIKKFPRVKDNIIKGITDTLRVNGVRIISDKEKFILEMTQIRKSLNQTLELKRQIHEQKSELELINRELERKNKELYKLAIFDDLTGSYSKKHFNCLLDNELSKSIRHNIVFGLLVLDIDDFKVFNDTFGHILGDSVLEELVCVLQKLLRKEDIIGRIGGEEFAIVLPHMNIEQSKTVACKIRDYLDSNTLIVDQKPLKITVSIGVTDSSICEPKTVQEIIYNGDIALYKAKNKGRNRVESFHSGMTMNSVLTNRCSF